MSSTGNEYSAEAVAAHLLELKGDWEQAEDLAREHFHDAVVMANMIALPVIGVIEARKGRPAAGSTLKQAWEIAVTSECQRQVPVAAAIAEHAWICGRAEVPISESHVDHGSWPRTGSQVVPRIRRHVAVETRRTRRSS